MESIPVTIRPARPDPDEGRAYAGYLDMAAEGFIRLMYGPECERIISEAFIQPQNDYSFENAVVAERGGNPCSARGAADLYFFVVEDGVVERRAVTLGRTLGADVEIMAGVIPGDRVVVNPSEGLIDGQRVRVQS